MSTIKPVTATYEGKSETIWSLYWEEDPDAGQVEVELPSEQTVTEAEIEEIMHRLEQFMIDAFRASQDSKIFRVGSVLVEARAQYVSSFSLSDLFNFSDEIRSFILNSWPKKELAASR